MQTKSRRGSTSGILTPSGGWVNFVENAPLHMLIGMMGMIMHVATQQVLFSEILALTQKMYFVTIYHLLFEYGLGSMHEESN